MLTYISMILACCMSAKVDRRRLYGASGAGGGASSNNDEFNNNNNNNNNDGFNNNDGYGVDINNNDLGNNDFGNSNDFSGGFSGSSGSYGMGGGMGAGGMAMGGYTGDTGIVMPSAAMPVDVVSGGYEYDTPGMASQSACSLPTVAMGYVLEPSCEVQGCFAGQCAQPVLVGVQCAEGFTGNPSCGACSHDNYEVMMSGCVSSGSYSTGGSYSSGSGSMSGSDSSGASTGQVTMSASNVFEDGFDLDYQFTGPEEGSQLHYYIREEGCGACSQDEPSLSEILSGDSATCYGSYSGSDEFDHNEHVNCGLTSASQYKLYVARSSTCCDAELVYSGMTMVVNSGHYEMATGYGTGYGVETEAVNGGVAVSGGYSMGGGSGSGASSGGSSSGGSSSSSSGGSSSSSSSGSSSGGSSGGSDSSGSGGGGDWSGGEEEEGDDDDDDDDDDGIMLQGPIKNLGKSLAPTPTMVLVVVGSVCLGIAAGLLFSCLRRKRAFSHEDFYSGLAESGDVHLDNTATVV